MAQKQNNEHWHAMRRQGIGGSDAAPVVGLSKWSTPLDIYLDKKGEREPVDETWEMSRGKALEPLLRQHYADTTGREVFVPNEPLKCEKYPFMIYNPDGLSNDNRLQEFKTAAYGSGWGVEGSDDIPTEYIIQVQHGLIVTGLEIADVTVSIAGNEPKYFIIKEDKELQEMIIEREHDFWQKVLDSTPPDPTTNQDVAKIYKSVNGEAIVADAGALALLHELKGIKNQIKALELEKESYEVQIKNYMKENEVLVAEDGVTKLATWKRQKGSTRIDSKLLKAQSPDIYDLYSKTGDPVRRFLLK
ncbi:lambda-exonuclease family protein [uncultured Paraglaciecola sp.]|uniref:YqaJ viral recombinase family nuclease n=1 Tax=uncultured Paraglaciecola sp. TaxID=1765024 RepID=UPI0026364D39|nr:YqaJ viral recombinase family protein [uncultured Paraglaciecola sp.]